MNTGNRLFCLSFCVSSEVFGSFLRSPQFPKLVLQRYTVDRGINHNAEYAEHKEHAHRQVAQSGVSPFDGPGHSTNILIPLWPFLHFYND
jgi:hypothetical protein